MLKILRYTILLGAFYVAGYMAFNGPYTWLGTAVFLLMLGIMLLMILSLTEKGPTTLSSDQIHTIQPIEPAANWIAKQTPSGGTWQYRIYSKDKLIMDSRWHMGNTGFQNEEFAIKIGKLNANRAPNYQLRIEAYDTSIDNPQVFKQYMEEGRAECAASQPDKTIQ